MFCTVVIYKHEINGTIFALHMYSNRVDSRQSYLEIVGLLQALIQVKSIVQRVDTG